MHRRDIDALTRGFKAALKGPDGGTATESAILKVADELAGVSSNFNRERFLSNLVVDDPRADPGEEL